MDMLNSTIYLPLIEIMLVLLYNYNLLIVVVSYCSSAAALYYMAHYILYYN